MPKNKQLTINNITSTKNSKIDEELLEKLKIAISRGHYKRLSGYPVYRAIIASGRDQGVNRGRRIIFCLNKSLNQEGFDVVALEELPTHDYENSETLQNNALMSLLRRKATINSESLSKLNIPYEDKKDGSDRKATPLEAKDTVIGAGTAYLYNGDFLSIRDKKQLDTKFCQIGPAGSGKTVSLALQLAEKAKRLKKQFDLKFNGDSSRPYDQAKLLFLTKHASLKDYFYNIFMSDYSELAPFIIFENISNLVKFEKTNIDKVNFNQWFKKKVRSTQKQKRKWNNKAKSEWEDWLGKQNKEVLLQEFRYRRYELAKNDSKLYKSVGQKYTLYPDAQDYVYLAYQDFSRSKHPDAKCHFDNIGDVDSVFIDEFSLFETEELMAVVRLLNGNIHNRLFLFGDPTQGEQRFALRPMLTACENYAKHLEPTVNTSLQLKTYMLKGSFRNGPQVTSLTNRILDCLAFAQYGIEKGQPRRVECKRAGTDSVEYICDSKLVATTIHSNPNIVIITRNSIIDKVSQLFPKNRVMTVVQAQGREFSQVVCYDIVKKLSKGLNKRFQENTRRLDALYYHQPKSNQDSQKVNENDIRQIKALLVGVTRATKQLVIFQSNITKSIAFFEYISPNSKFKNGMSTTALPDNRKDLKLTAKITRNNSLAKKKDIKAEKFIVNEKLIRELRDNLLLNPQDACKELEIVRKNDVLKKVIESGWGYFKPDAHQKFINESGIVFWLIGIANKFQNIEDEFSGLDENTQHAFIVKTKKYLEKLDDDSCKKLFYQPKAKMQHYMTKKIDKRFGEAISFLETIKMENTRAQKTTRIEADVKLTKSTLKPKELAEQKKAITPIRFERKKSKHHKVDGKEIKTMTLMDLFEQRLRARARQDDKKSNSVLYIDESNHTYRNSSHAIIQPKPSPATSKRQSIKDFLERVIKKDSKEDDDKIINQFCIGLKHGLVVAYKHVHALARDVSKSPNVTNKSITKVSLTAEWDWRQSLLYLIKSSRPDKRLVIDIIEMIVSEFETKKLNGDYAVFAFVITAEYYACFEDNEEKRIGFVNKGRPQEIWQQYAYHILIHNSHKARHYIKALEQVKDKEVKENLSNYQYLINAIESSHEIATLEAATIITHPNEKSKTIENKLLKIVYYLHKKNNVFAMHTIVTIYCHYPEMLYKFKSHALYLARRLTNLCIDIGLLEFFNRFSKMNQLTIRDEILFFKYYQCLYPDGSKQGFEKLFQPTKIANLYLVSPRQEKRNFLFLLRCLAVDDISQAKTILEKSKISRSPVTEQIVDEILNSYSIVMSMMVADSMKDKLEKTGGVINLSQLMQILSICFNGVDESVLKTNNHNFYKEISSQCSQLLFELLAITIANNKEKHSGHLTYGVVLLQQRLLQAELIEMRNIIMQHPKITREHLIEPYRKIVGFLEILEIYPLTIEFILELKLNILNFVKSTSPNKSLQLGDRLESIERLQAIFNQDFSKYLIHKQPLNQEVAQQRMKQKL